jgi:nitric oxide dioxygenase
MLTSLRNDNTEVRTLAPIHRGWPGWRDFTVAAKTRESEFVTSFLLRPAQGAALRHLPGQHLTLLLDIPGRPRLKRSYSISSPPDNEGYRISVKREAMGAASNWLHNSVEPGTVIPAMAPKGTFVLPKCPSRPIVLLGGGVGVTPLISMLGALAERGIEVPVHFVHCTANSSTHIFGDYLREMQARYPSLSVTTFFSRPLPADVAGRDFHHSGRIDMARLSAQTPLTEADIFLCGPRPFMRRFAVGLSKAGIARRQLHTEFFGPVEDLFDDAVDFEVPLAAPTIVDAPKVLRKLAPPAFNEDDIGRALLNNASDAVVASDREGHILVWNSGAERIFGFTAAEAVGRTLDIIIPEPFRERHWQGYRAVVETGVSRYGDGDILTVPGQHKDGHRISLEFTISPLKAAGAVIGIVANMRDVTRRYEETKALKKRISELGGGDA